VQFRALGAQLLVLLLQPGRSPRSGDAIRKRIMAHRSRLQSVAHAGKALPIKMASPLSFRRALINHDCPAASAAATRGGPRVRRRTLGTGLRQAGIGKRLADAQPPSALFPRDMAQCAGLQNLPLGGGRRLVCVPSYGRARARNSAATNSAQATQGSVPV